MARAIWTGVISFGLVSVPVGLYSATADHEVTFHQFEEGTEDRIRYKRVNERTDEVVDYSHIVKGADVGDHYVMVGPEELESVAPGRSRALEIERFVNLDEIDPLHFSKSYYLGPRGEDQRQAYALLRDAMAAQNKAAIATFVMRGKEYLAALRADGKVLVLETMFFADEIRDPETEIDDLPGPSDKKSRELAMATQLIDTMAGPWEPTGYRDTYTERVKELISAKDEGHEVKPEAEAPEATNVVDLVSMLRRSVEAARARRPGEQPAPDLNPSPKKPTKKTTTKAPARKSAGHKSAGQQTSARKSDQKSSAKKTSAKKTTRKAS